MIPSPLLPTPLSKAMPSMKPSLVLLALLVVGCGGGPPPPPSQQPIAAVSVEERLYYDNSGAYPDSTRLVVRDAETFRQVWGQATAEQPSPPPLPNVDFEESMVLLVAAGRMTPEDRIRVDSVGVRSVPRTDGGQEDVLSVVVSTVRGCGRLAVDAYPMELVRIPDFDGRIEFLERSRRECPNGAALGARRAPADRVANTRGARMDSGGGGDGG